MPSMGSCNTGRRSNSMIWAAVSAKCINQKASDCPRSFQFMAHGTDQRLWGYFYIDAEIHAQSRNCQTGSCVYSLPEYRKPPDAPPSWGLRALNLPCHSHWKIQVLERSSHLFYVAKYSPTERDSQPQTWGSTWGTWSQRPYKQENRTDSWTRELLLLTGWDLALSSNNYYRQ